MQLVDIIQEHLSYIWSFVRVCKWYKVCIFGKSVNYHKNYQARSDDFKKKYIISLRPGCRACRISWDLPNRATNCHTRSKGVAAKVSHASFGFSASSMCDNRLLSTVAFSTNKALPASTFHFAARLHRHKVLSKASCQPLRACYPPTFNTYCI